MLRQFLMFAAVGAVGTAGHYAVLIALVQLAGVPATIATTAGFAVGAVINYWLNYRITFNSSRSHLQALPRFMLIAATGAVLNGLVMWLLVRAGVHYMLAQLVATALVLVWNYLLNRLWTFSSQPAGDDRQAGR